MLEKWDGALPKVNGSDSSLLLNVDDAVAAQQSVPQQSAEPSPTTTE